MENQLDKVIRDQKRGTPSGIYSVCSSHPSVLLAALRFARDHGSCLLLEATCNQVNQFGGYTGMQPRDFVAYLHDLAAQAAFPAEKLILGVIISARTSGQLNLRKKRCKISRTRSCLCQCWFHQDSPGCQYARG